MRIVRAVVGSVIPKTNIRGRIVSLTGSREKWVEFARKHEGPAPANTQELVEALRGAPPEGIVWVFQAQKNMGANRSNAERGLALFLVADPELYDTLIQDLDTLRHAIASLDYTVTHQHR